MKSKKIIIVVIFIFILCFGTISCTRQQANPVVLIVSAAGVYRNSLLEIGELYKQEKPNVKINYNIAGSGLLREQIQRGAPVDIYISGIEKEMDKLKSLGLLIPETRQNLTKNSIALIVPKDSSIFISNFIDLTDERVKTVALGSEKVSAGIYTKQVLDFYKIFEAVRKKGIFADEDIRQVLRSVEDKDADSGITFLTEGKLSNKVRIAAIAPKSSHTPVISPVAVLKRCQNVPEAKAFIKFLNSDRAAAIFEKYGFIIIK